MNRFFYSLLIIVFCMFGVVVVQAETEEQTINKCLADLKSKDKSVRQRAVLILSKYQRSDVFRNLIPILDDPDPKVRESTVVGFIESRIMMRDAAMPILRRLTDSNVHTRRMVSSTLLPRISFYISANKAETEKILKKASQDKDTIVRKNIINNYYTLRRNLDISNFYHFLGDESSQIRLIALNKLSSFLSFKAMTPYLQKLVTDDDAKIRKQVLKSLGGFGQAGKAYLKVMAKDPDPTIAARAMAYTRNPSYLPKMYKIINDPSSPSDLIVDLVMTIVNWSVDSKKFVQSLLEDADETRRFAALNALVRMGSKFEQSSLSKLIKEDSSRIRKLASSVIANKPVTADIVSEMALSEYSDVRELSLTLAVKNSARIPAMKDALYDLMLDEEIVIRTKALQAIWVSRVEDRYEIFEQSLTDDEPAVRDIAAKTLLSSREPKAKAIIQKFQKNNKSVNIAHLETLNEAEKIRSFMKNQTANWQQSVIKAFQNKNYEVKQAAVDVTLKLRDPLLVNELRKYLNLKNDRKLADYLYKKIAEEE
ncbi:MAG: HEAT repeat domain-containing protein [Lentisphaeraceae bacterium]|nr:HEAT repeat domain-containing protein [Lentisphaeraceae bacterium]